MLHRKGHGKEAKLAYLGHVLLDNRHGLVANVCATHATGTAEREAAALLLEASAPPGSTVGADKGYDVASFVADVRVRDVTPHVAQKVRWSAIDGRTTRHAGYHVSQRKDPLVVERFHPRISTSVMFALGHLADEVLSIIRATAPPVDSHLRIRTKRSRPVDDAVSLP